MAGNVGGVAAATLVAFTLLNATGVRSGSFVQQLTSLLKMLMLVGFVALWLLAEPAHPAATTATVAATEPLRGMVLAVALVVSTQLVIETYSGWYTAVYFAEEDRDPGRNLPHALFIGVLLIIAIYVLMNLSYLHVLPLGVLSASKLPAADAMQAVLGARAGQLVTALAGLSLLAILNAAFMSTPRILYGLSRDGLLSGRVQRVNRGGTPVAALALTATAAVALAAIGSFERLFLFAAFIVVLIDMVLATALFVMRRREPGLVRPYRALAYPLLPLLFATLAFALFVGFLVTDPWISSLAIAAILASYSLYRLSRR